MCVAAWWNMYNIYLLENIVETPKRLLGIMSFAARKAITKKKKMAQRNSSPKNGSQTKHKTAPCHTAHYRDEKVSWRPEIQSTFEKYFIYNPF